MTTSEGEADPHLHTLHVKDHVDPSTYTTHSRSPINLTFKPHLSGKRRGTRIKYSSALNYSNCTFSPSTTLRKLPWPANAGIIGLYLTCRPASTPLSHTHPVIREWNKLERCGGWNENEHTLIIQIRLIPCYGCPLSSVVRACQ